MGKICSSQVVLVVKNLPTNAGDAGLIPESGRFPGEGNGNSLQYSCLGNPTDRGTWQATVHGITKGSESTQPLGEGTGTPLQYSCLENPMDRGAWWAAVHGVARSQTRLKRLSSSSSNSTTKQQQGSVTFSDSFNKQLLKACRIIGNRLIQSSQLPSQEGIINPFYR